MVIKVVTFDLWQTLIYETVEQENLRKQMRADGITDLLVQHGIKVDPDRFYEAHQQAWLKCEKIWNTDKDISIKEQIIIFMQCVDDQVNWQNLPDTLWDKLIIAFTNPVIQKPPFLFEDTKETLAYLKQKGLKIGLICNTGRTPGTALRNILKQLNIIQYFDTLTFSNELLIRKPALEIFRHTLNNLSVNPSQSIHIGDNPIADVTGAKRSGMKAIWRHGEDTRQPEIQPDFEIANLIELTNII